MQSMTDKKRECDTLRVEGARKFIGAIDPTELEKEL